MSADSKMGAHSVVGRADVLWRHVVDGVLIRLRGADEPVLLTGSGVILWSELSEPASVDNLIERLADAHGADRAEVSADVTAVVAELVRRRILVER